MLAVQSEWKRVEQRRGGQGAPWRSSGSTSDSIGTVPQDAPEAERTDVPRFVVLDGAAAKPGRPLP
jgi:hypothetical protein